jgi:hypothetical protein
MATSKFVESGLSRLRFAKTDFRCKLKWLAMEGSMQSSYIIATARKIAVPIDFHGW